MAPFPSPTSTWHNNTYQSISPTRPELSAKGKTIVVTGGGTGIGAETARCFAEAGAPRITLLGRREQPLLDTKTSIELKFPSIQVIAKPCDVTKKSDLDAAFIEAAGNGKVDILISNAAIVGPVIPVGDVDGDKFLDAIQQNLKGTLNIAQAFLRHAGSDAVVIETNSSAAHINFASGFAAYSVAKLAVFRLWDHLGYENPGLNVFHVQPGIVATDMNREAGGTDDISSYDDVSLPATFMVWIASPEARFLKGKFLWANWDVDEMKAKAKEIESTALFNIVPGGWPFGVTT